MRKLPLYVLLCLFLFAPAAAQEATPTPAPPSSLGGIAREVQQTGDALGDLENTVGANTFIYLIGSGVLALVIWFGLRPGMSNVSKNQENVASAQRDLASAHRESVGVQRDLLGYLRNSDKVIERNTEAFEGVKAAYDASAKDFGKLATSVTDTWTNLQVQLRKDRDAEKAEIMQTEEQIKQVNKRLDAVVDVVKEIQNEIIPGGGYRKALDRVIQMLEQSKLRDTGELPPLSSITDKDPHAPSDPK